MQLTSFLQDKQLTIALNGEIDHHSAKNALHNIGDKINQFMPMVCILDFKGISFMDSSGIAIVIHTYRRMKELGGKLKLKNLTQQPWRVLHASGVDRIVETERRIDNDEV